MTLHAHRLTLLALTVGLALTVALPAQSEIEVGVTAAINTEAVSTPPGGSTRSLVLGAEIVQDEVISTTESGLAQILFLDQTTLTVGANSEIVIDEFVFDPATAEGSLTMSATVGVFRLIGGDVSAAGGVDVNTPFATIGIRGSNIVIRIRPDGTGTYTCNYCEEMTVVWTAPDGKRITYIVEGADRYRTVDVGANGISDPYELPIEEESEQEAALTSDQGNNGGTGAPPSDEDVEDGLAGNENGEPPPEEQEPGTQSALLDEELVLLEEEEELELVELPTTPPAEVVNELPFIGTASYTGMVTVDIEDVSLMYTAVGTIDITMDFGDPGYPPANRAIVDVDGITYDMDLTFGVGGVVFAGTDELGDYSMTGNGTFSDGPNTWYGNLDGVLSITSVTAYTGTGTWTAACNGGVC